METLGKNLNKFITKFLKETMSKSSIKKLLKIEIMS